MGECTNCDFIERLNQLKQTKPNERLYGKAQLHSHEQYDLIHETPVDGKYFEASKISRLYALFKYNIVQCLREEIFDYKWVSPDKLLTATKGKIWDWSSRQEFDKTVDSLLNFGVYFPIFTLDKGILHNQVDPMPDSSWVDKYNSYNGNHRIDAIQYLYSKGHYSGKVLIIIIPEFCEKSCNGFRYTPIDYNSKDIPEIVTSHPLNHSLKLFHLSYLEEEMKMNNIPTLEKDMYLGVDLVHVVDYQCAFRILQEFQNALEVPLTRFYSRYGFLPNGVEPEMFNIRDSLESAIMEMACDNNCEYKSEGDTCFLLNTSRNCGKLICCLKCPKLNDIYSGDGPCKDACLPCKRAQKGQQL